MRFRIIRLVFITLVVSFIGCSDKDNDEEKLATNVFGKWEAISITDSEGTFLYEHECHNKKDFIEIYTDGKLKSVYYEQDCTEEIEAGTYSLSGDKITIMGNDIGNGTYVCKVGGKEMEWKNEKETIKWKKL